MHKRTTISLILLIGAFFLPPWLIMILAISGIFLFEYFFEAIFAGFIIDVLYGTTVNFMHIFLLYTFFITIALVIISSIKRKLKFYQ